MTEGGRRPRLAEVARAAGVSEITASRVMRGVSGVAPGTVERVRAAADRLGYLRNSLAGALAGQDARTRQVAVVLPSLSNAVFSEVLRGIEDRLEGAGYHPILGVSHYDPAREAALIASLLGWQPAGLIVAPTEMGEPTRQMLRKAGVPVVEIMDLPEDPVDMAVGLSQAGAGKAMGYFLAGRGVRRVAVVEHGVQADGRAARRVAGFRAAMQEAGVEIVAETRCPGPSSVAAGRHATAEVLGAAPEVIWYPNDDMAIGGYFECLARGIAVPGQVGLVGFNGLEWGQALPVPLSTIETHRHEMGARAADLILARRAGREAPRIVDVGFRLIAGGTVKGATGTGG